MKFFVLKSFQVVSETFKNRVFFHFLSFMSDGVVFAEELAKHYRAVSVAEFFEKNRHLLGFGSKRQALLTCIKEMVDNSLDACEEIKELPNVLVKVSHVKGDVYKVLVEDNGPGIVKRNLGHAFGKLLYGSKFHGNKQARGQQGIGVTSCILYAQLTTGKPSKITSKISDKDPAHVITLMIDTAKNEPKILEEGVDNKFNHRGTRVEIEIEAEYLSTGKQSVYEYLKRTSIVNPHAQIMFITPEGRKHLFKRSVNTIPKQAKRIKPHPDGLELGIMLKMLMSSEKKSLKSFLTGEFSSIGSKTAQEILEKTGLDERIKPTMVSRDQAEKLLKAMQSVKIQAPPLDCLSPIGEVNLLRSLKSEIPAEFYTTVTRKPTAYSGMPFQVEVGLAYGGELPSDKKAQILRFANKVPLIYEDYACAITQAVKDIDWKRYGIENPGGVPKGPLMIVVHVASVWVPFTSEGKQAIASRPEILKEIKLGLMEAARKMQKYINKKERVRREKERVDTFQRYSLEVAHALSKILGVGEEEVQSRIQKLLLKGGGSEEE